MENLAAWFAAQDMSIPRLSLGKEDAIQALPVNFKYAILQFKVLRE
jgi:hypothetical protein